MKTSLGIWAFGNMATRFNAGGYKPELTGISTVQGWDYSRAGAIASIRSSVSLVSLSAPAGSTPSSCSIVRGPMIGAVTPCWRSCFTRLPASVW